MEGRPLFSSAPMGGPYTEEADEATEKRTPPATVDEQLEQTWGTGKYQWLLLLMMGPGVWTAEAFHLMVITYIEDDIGRTFGVTGFLQSLAGSSAFMGAMIGAYVWSCVADRQGRRVVVWITLAGSNVLGCCTATAQTYWVFLVLRACVGFFFAGTVLAGYGLTIEFFPPRRRGLATIVINCAWAVMLIAVTGLCYAMHHHSWRLTLLTGSLISFFPFAFAPFVDESIRFLLAAGRMEDAEMLLTRIARVNGVSTTIPQHLRVLPAPTSELGSLPALVKSLPLSSLVMAAVWFVSSFVYYGLSFEVGHLSGSTYINGVALAAVDIPAYFLAWYFVDHRWWGRKRTTILFYAEAGIALAALAVDFPHNVTRILAVVGKFAIAGTWLSIFVYASELFPTSVRAVGLGMCSVSTRVGGILSPTIAEVLPLRGALLVFGAFSLVAAVATMWLRETLGQSMLEHLTEKSNDITDDDTDP